MDLKELTNSLNRLNENLAYKIWKQSYLITLGIKDLFREKGNSEFPTTPREASPELYPPKASIEKPSFLNNKNIKMKDGEMIYGRNF